MKKKFCLIIMLFLCLHNIHAADNATIKNVTTLESGRYFYKVLNLTTGKTGYFYHIRLDSVRAIGLDLGLKINKNDSYKYAYSIPQNGAAMNANQQVMAKAYYYAKNNGTDDTIKVAQIIIWLGGPTSKEVVYDNVDASERTIVDSIYAYTLSSNAKLSVWEHALSPGVYSKVLTDVKGETNEACKVDIDDNLPDCVGDSKSNYGFIKETSRGNCLSGFDKVTKNNVSIYGQKQADYGAYCRMYCLRQFNEELPGNIKNAVPVGRYIVWPNNNIDNNKYKSDANLITYPMSTSLTKTCKISVDKTHLESDYSSQKTIMNTIKKNYPDVDSYYLSTKTCTKFYDNWQQKERELANKINEVNNARNQATAARNQANYTCSHIPECDYIPDTCYQSETCSYDCSYYQSDTCWDEDCYESCGTAGIWQECGTTCSYYSYECGYTVHQTCSYECGYWYDCSYYDCTRRNAAQRKCSQEKQDATNKENILKQKENEKAAIERDRDYWKNRNTQCENYKKAYINAQNVIKELNSCIKANPNMTISYTLTNPYVEHNDPEYGGTFSLRQTKEEKQCTDCVSNISTVATTPESIEVGTLTGKANAIEARNIVSEVKKEYDLIENPGMYYYYVNKNTGKSVHTNSGLTNYSTIGFSNIPISYNADIKTKYNLSIKINGITGDADVFNSQVKMNNYTCNYKVTKSSNVCICPEGTKHAGESLVCILKENNMTCADAKERYCNSETETIPHDCDPDVSCEDGKDLTSCINTNYTFNECKQEFCDGHNKCTVGCDENGRWIDDEGNDITACVISMMLKGYTEYQSYKYCKDRLGSSDGIKIIYRTIDLNNPFPSKDADASVEEKNLKAGAFNETLRGRYPGSNWNSENLVKSKILNNRDAEGDNIYKKEPLYSFTLNNDTIKTIRGYNQAQGHNYDDFNLVCLNNNSACKSSFVHNPSYGISGGSCYSVSKDNFYRCTK